MKRLKTFCLTLMSVTALVSHATTMFTLDSSTKVDLTYGSNAEYATIVTTGTDPHITTLGVASDMHTKDSRIEFYYQSSEDIDDLQIFFRDPESEQRSMHVKNLIKKCSTWTHVSIPIATQRSSFSWGKAGSKLRFDFGNKSGVTIKIRQLGVFGHTVMSTADRNTFARGVERYLAGEYPSRITNVKVDDSYVYISGYASTGGSKLVGIRLDGSATLMTNYYDVANLDAGGFSVKVKRFEDVDGLNYDHLLSKWAVVDGDHKLLSHAHYADDIVAVRTPEPGILKSKKGIGGIGDASVKDIDPLGLTSATFNIVLNTVLSCNNTGGYNIPYVYNGHTYYVNAGVQESNDRVLKECENKGVVVAAILLVHPGGGEAEYGTALLHPEYGGTGHYSMPDMTNVHSIMAYAATIDYLANRYSIKGNGRIHHWIMHNEVDQNKEWTDMGTGQPLLRYVDTYEKSMRLVANIVHQYDSNAYILASFTSSWNKSHSTDGYSTKSMLDNIVCYSNAEGDYRWGVAAHPYPQDFFKPKFWSTDTEATYNENSGFSTFKNIEVISDWMLRREHYFRGVEKRILFFSENGTNSLDNSTDNLNVQAAGAAWAWKKVMKNSGVDAIMWHNWFDNPAEGLCLGLRDKDLNAKPSWYVWQAAGTANESAIFDKYLSVIGISNWEQIHNSVSTSGKESMRLELDQTSNVGVSVTYDGTYQYYTLVSNSTDPRINTQAMTAAKSDNSNVLAFDYKCDQDINEFQVFISPLAYEERSVKVNLKATNEWKRAYIDLTPLVKQYGWGGVGSQLRLDPGSVSGRTFKIRHICINSGEKTDVATLFVGSAGANNCTLAIDNSAGYATITTSTGGDPFFYTTPLQANLTSEANTLMFEYQASTKVAGAQLYFVDYAGEQRSIKIGDLSAATSWKRVVVNIEDLCRTHGWGFEGDYIRFDPGTQSGLTFKIRNICINKGNFESARNLLLDNYNCHDVALSHNVETQPAGSDFRGPKDAYYRSWAVRTIGSDPYVFSVPLDVNLNDDATKLYFEYKSSVDVNTVELFFCYPESPARSCKYNGVMPASDEWRKVVLDISAMRSAYGWGYAGQRLRIDLGNIVGAGIDLSRVAIYNGDNGTVGVDEISPVDDTFVVRGIRGGVVITSGAKQTFTIYNVVGVMVKQLEFEGETVVSLAPGVYIVNGNKVVVG